MDIELVITHISRFAEQNNTSMNLLRMDLSATLRPSARSSGGIFSKIQHTTLIRSFIDVRAEIVSVYINEEKDVINALEEQTVKDSGGSGVIVVDNGPFTMIDCTVVLDKSISVCDFVVILPNFRSR